MEKLIRTTEEAIDCLKKNKPASGYIMLQESVDMAIEALENKFAGEGRVLIRPSGTEPLVRVMIEGKNQQEIDDEAKKLAKLITRVML